jgi:hypothetical protein
MNRLRDKSFQKAQRNSSSAQGAAQAARVGEAAGDSNSLRESVSRERLIDILNYVNFKGDSVVVNLRSVRDGSMLSLKAAPEPCCGDAARLAWSDKPPAHINALYEFSDFFIDKGSRVVMVGGLATEVSRSGITVLLPERCYATSRRRMERFSSASVRATLSWNGSEATGVLGDFSAGFLKVRLVAREAGFILKARRQLPLQIVLRSGGTIVYDGKGLIKRRIANGENIDLVLTLIPYVQDKSEGSRGVACDPALIAIYRHPLSGRIIRLHVAKASYNTFVVNEDPEHAVLFQGLVIPDMRIDFGAGDSAQCSAKVEGGEPGAWFIAILDMPIIDQRKLFSFIEKETGMSSGVSEVIDPEDLLEFFFEAGFIYPEKYAGLARSREGIKQILSRLYIETPSVCQHFVRYNRGVIGAHVCMVRFYERAWVVHHHAAIGGSGAGSAVLTQIFRYIHSYSALPSAGLDYVMLYYRPENRFPNRVFGGLARFLNTPSLCSVDPFAYLHLRFDRSGRETHGEREWQIEPAARQHLHKLEDFYNGISGGLTLKAFGLEAGEQGRETVDLNREFEKAGLRRRKSFFALREGERLKAVMMALDSDVGLNMSNLMKSIHVFVVDKEGLPFDLLIRQLNRLSFLYEDLEIPILLFPSSYAVDQGAAFEKVYDLLTFSVSVGEQFLEYVEGLTNRAVRRKYGAPAQEREASER